jgi:hypothetical protein
VKKKREIKFENIKEALKGISEEMITKHKLAQTNCWGYRREGHYTLEYYANKRDHRENIVKATVLLLRREIRQ